MLINICIAPNRISYQISIDNVSDAWYFNSYPIEIYTIMEGKISNIELHEYLCLTYCFSDMASFNK